MDMVVKEIEDGEETKNNVTWTGMETDTQKVTLGELLR